MIFKILTIITIIIISSSRLEAVVAVATKK